MKFSWFVKPGTFHVNYNYKFSQIFHFRVGFRCGAKDFDKALMKLFLHLKNRKVVTFNTESDISLSKRAKNLYANDSQQRNCLKIRRKTRRKLMECDWYSF